VFLTLIHIVHTLLWVTIGDKGYLFDGLIRGRFSLGVLGEKISSLKNSFEAGFFG
jgi:hypothetical protein